MSVTAKELSAQIVEFLRGQGQLALLPEITKELEKETAKEVVTITSAVELSEAEKAAARAKLGDSAKFVTNPRILGGLIVDHGGLRTDLSVLGRLNKMVGA